MNAAAIVCGLLLTPCSQVPKEPEVLDKAEVRRVFEQCMAIYDYSLPKVDMCYLLSHQIVRKRMQQNEKPR